MDLSVSEAIQILCVTTAEVKGSMHTVTFLPVTGKIFLTTFQQECHAFKVMARVDILFRHGNDYLTGF
jgi:hypothetical protein